MRTLSCLLGLLTTLTLAGCSANMGGALRYTDEGVRKSTVEVLPVIDRTHTAFPWSLSQEVTEEVRYRLQRSPDMLVAARMGSSYPDMRRYKPEELMGSRMRFAKDFPGADYILLMELTDHEIKPYNNETVKPVYPVGGEATEVIMMRMHVRLIDARQEEPRVVMQREVLSNHLVPKGREFSAVDYAELQPGHESYLATPVGRAHARLSRDIAEQVQLYIEPAR